MWSRILPLMRRPEASLWGYSGTPDDDRLVISSPQILARVLTVKIGSTGMDSGEWANGRNDFGSHLLRDIASRNALPWA
jgi:hypothetical protein